MNEFDTKKTCVLLMINRFRDEDNGNKNESNKFYNSICIDFLSYLERDICIPTFNIVDMNLK